MAGLNNDVTSVLVDIYRIKTWCVEQLVEIQVHMFLFTKFDSMKLCQTIEYIIEYISCF